MPTSPPAPDSDAAAVARDAALLEAVARVRDLHARRRNLHGEYRKAVERESTLAAQLRDLEKELAMAHKMLEQKAVLSRQDQGP